MMSLHGLEALNRAFAEQAAAVGADAVVQSAIWPTAGQMINHLGNVQAWVTEIVRTGAPADRKALVRPEDEDPVEWFTQTSRRLVATLASVNPDRECWTLFEAPPVASFWGRRMTYEAAKHLWDLRTASDAAPRMPDELELGQQADAIDEFVEVFVPAARARGIEPLPHDLFLVADDIDRSWRFTADWNVIAATGTDVPLASEVLRGDVGDLALVLWERANPWQLPGRFRIENGDIALRALVSTPVHL
ncbi:MAG: maleylpyruvate isomerase N-terminal domain-containing protein [Microbacterium sp.]|uniref:maleylpyruvate isomerase N-terminal domain-containing protein n=1 Tax=Microbacterium sp. TaxID=51671 RepID=UPI0027258200|nr:maleylpyruvate isomerase N-terminal domain-containing protein [Microbacterium sp.]MDO8381626.1 maleylpyruvate isomerase N-terminal domain-containing protein [Microbacterium sp.]